MSLVEKALEKVQQEKRAAAAVELHPMDSQPERPANTVRMALPAHPLTARTEPPRPPARVIQLNRASMRAAGLLAPADENERVVAHQFLQIKRPLLENAFGRRGGARVPAGNLIMVCSALPGDGKTFTTMNLALSLARETDTDVLLVDADVAKSHVSRTLGLEKEPGLMDALERAGNVESLILDTDVPGLQVLPAGTLSKHATELLASERMQKILTDLCSARSNRIVLFDTPPLLITNEAPVLARAAGQIVLVVRAGVTPQPAVMEAAALLDQNKFIGLVFNQSRNSTVDRYGYYDYGGRDAGPDQQEAED